VTSGVVVKPSRLTEGWTLGMAASKSGMVMARPTSSFILRGPAPNLERSGGGGEGRKMIRGEAYLATRKENEILTG
jgi:hypothetical protein